MDFSHQHTNMLKPYLKKPHKQHKRQNQTTSPLICHSLTATTLLLYSRANKSPLSHLPMALSSAHSSGLYSNRLHWRGSYQGHHRSLPWENQWWVLYPHLTSLLNSIWFLFESLLNSSFQLSACLCPPGICPPLSPLLFYVLLQNKFTLFHGFKYPFNADDSQMSVSNWSLFPELQIHISKYLLNFQFRCLIIILSLYDHNFPP